MKFRFIDKHKESHRVQAMCQLFGVTSSEYYQWKNRSKSNREKENDFLLEKIKDTYELNRCVYGIPRITQALNRAYISCSQPRVARLVRASGIVAKTQRKFKATTNSNHTLPVAADLEGQAFGVDGPSFSIRLQNTC